MTVAVTKEIDARSSFCPGPLIEMIRALRAAKLGDGVAVRSTDPVSRADIPAWVASTNHELVAVEDCGGYVRFVVRKAGGR